MMVNRSAGNFVLFYIHLFSMETKEH